MGESQSYTEPSRGKKPSGTGPSPKNLTGLGSGRLAFIGKDLRASCQTYRGRPVSDTQEVLNIARIAVSREGLRIIFRVTA